MSITTATLSIAAAPWELTRLARLGPAFVGAVFIYAGSVKAVAPLNFQSHLSRLGWIPLRLLAATVVTVAVIETALGIALLVGLTPGLTLPVTAVSILLLGAASVWSMRSGRVTDCGCYGGYFTPSVAQSVTLNTLYATLLLLAWTAGALEAVSAWKVCLVAGVAVIAGTLTGVAQHHESVHGRPLVDLNPLKPGRRWRAAWAGGAASSEPKERLVAYLGTDCPFCHQWVRVLNVVHGSPALPDVVGVVGAPTEARQAFAEEHGIRFPVVSIRKSRMDRLVSGVPTAVLIEHGVITSKWVGQIAPEFLTRFNRVFFPDTQRAGRAALEASAER